MANTLSTAEGKAAVAKNATKHGLFARKDVVISENQDNVRLFSRRN